jgi:hypothetical protein
MSSDASRVICGEDTVLRSLKTPSRKVMERLCAEMPEDVEKSCSHMPEGKAARSLSRN